MENVEQMDRSIKNFLQSKTIWGIILLISPIVSKLLGFDVEVEVGESYDEIIQIIGSALAFYGRWKANGEIVVTKFKKTEKGV